ncbi:MAG: ATPase, T2SS/T4P/T4SS family, partial [bacterium]
EEAVEMLQAMNTGHEGSMSSIHANGPHHALTRLADLVLQEERWTASSSARAIAEAIDFVVHMVEEHASGRRVVAAIAQVAGRDGEVVLANEVYRWREGRLAPTGIAPLREGGPVPR